MSSGWGNGEDKVVLSYAKHRGMVDGKSSEQPEHPLCISGKYDCDENWEIAYVDEANEDTCFARAEYNERTLWAEVSGTKNGIVTY